MIALLLLCAARPAPDFQEAVRLAQQNQLAAAHAVASGLADGMERGQALTYVRLAAGDFAGAWRAATDGIRHAPDDLWLHERRASISLALGSSSHAANDVGELRRCLERVEETLELAALASWEATVEDYERQARELADAEAAREASVASARLTAGVGVAALIAGALLLGYSKRASSALAPEST